MGYDIFVSHSTQDKLFADALVNRLENEKIRCWYAPRDIPPGMAWPSAIAAAIRQSPVMLLVFSAAANRSDEISRELTLASNNKRVVIPVRIENVLPSQELEYHLTNRHWLDVYDLEMDAAMNEIMEVVQSYSNLLRGGAAPADVSAYASGASPADVPARSGRLAAELAFRRRLKRWLPVLAGLLLLLLGGLLLKPGGNDGYPPVQPQPGAPVYVYGTVDGLRVRTLRLESGDTPEHLVLVQGLPQGLGGDGIYYCEQSVKGEEYIFSTQSEGRRRTVFRVLYGVGFVFDLGTGESFGVSYIKDTNDAKSVQDMLDAWKKRENG